MYQEIKYYLDNILKQGECEELEKASDILRGMYDMKLLDNREYCQALQELEDRLINLGEGLEELNLGSRARTVLRRSGIKTKSDLKNILTGKTQNLHFLKLRNMGVVTEEEIVCAALDSGIVTYEELGKEYGEAWEIRRWEKIKEKVGKKSGN